MSKKLFKVKNVTKRFGGVIAVNDFSLEVDENEIVGIIGPNGSGKTTTFNLIMGVERADKGEIYFKNIRLDHMKTYQVVRMGIGRTFQLIRLFGNLTALENLLVPYSRSKTDERSERAIRLLEFFNLIHLKDELTSNFSFGQQKLLELARVLMMDPKLILLDEPTGGVNPVLTNKISNYIKKLRTKGKTFIVIEHNLPVVKYLCDRIIVLDHGEKIAEGKLKNLRHNKRVINAYFGDAQ